METNQLEQYYATLNSIEANLHKMSCEVAESYLEQLFAFKPVRLKWYLVKARLMLKQERQPKDIVEFLIDKCDPWYDYEDVDAYFELMSMLYECMGDLAESMRYTYQYNKLREVMYGLRGGNVVVDDKMSDLVDKVNAKENIQVQDVLDLAELYYIKGNLYLYLLWALVANKVFDLQEIKIRDEVLRKYNVGYYWERLANSKKEVFGVIITSKGDEKDCLLAVKALKLLGKEAVLLNAPRVWEKTEDIQDAVACSIQTIREEAGVYRADIYCIGEGESQKDTRLEVLRYVARKYSEEDLITVLGSGLLVDQIAMDTNARPRFERLTPADADYLEENIAVARYGDYLNYVANIYRTSRSEIVEELYRKPNCRFSIIIPCRNAGKTLHYTLKTCLNQDFAGSYEIVVSDNSDAAWGLDTPTYRMCQEFQDSRIKYYRTPGNLSLMKNFEYGYLKAKGEFLISMGADDGILPWALKELDRVMTITPNVPVWLWHEAFYKWADVDENLMQGAGSAQLIVSKVYEKGSPERFEYSTREIFQKSFSQYGMMYYLPQVYHNSGIRREYMQTLYEKTGVLWGGISQDMCMAVTIANVEEKLHFIDNPLTITGISSASIGANSRAGNTNLEQVNMEKKMRSTFAQGWRVPGYIERLCPASGAEYSGLYACMLYAYAIGVITDETFSSFDWKLMFEQSVKEIRKEDILYDKKLHRLRYAVSIQGTEMLEWFDNALYNQAVIPCVVESPTVKDDNMDSYKEYIQIQQKKINAEPYCISDVYKVSTFLEKIFDKKPDDIGE